MGNRGTPVAGQFTRLPRATLRFTLDWSGEKTSWKKPRQAAVGAADGPSPAGTGSVSLTVGREDRQVLQDVRQRAVALGWVELSEHCWFSWSARAFTSWTLTTCRTPTLVSSRPRHGLLRVPWTSESCGLMLPFVAELPNAEMASLPFATVGPLSFPMASARERPPPTFRRQKRRPPRRPLPS